MKRRNFLQFSSILGLLGILPATKLAAADTAIEPDGKNVNERKYWVELLAKIAAPVLTNMSKGELKKNMPVEFSPTWDNRNKDVAYMEAFGRLVAGLAPFLALPADDTEEGKIRQQLLLQTQQSLAHAVNPSSPDYLYWGSPASRQPLVDAAFIAQALLAAPEVLWKPFIQKVGLWFSLLDPLSGLALS